MLLEELHRLVAKGESENLEFKKTTGQQTEAVKTVCALLNGLGGFVLFGVSDRGEILGQQVSEKTLKDISLELRRIEPPVFPEIETVSIKEDKMVIVLRVSGKMGTYSYDGRVYVRYGPTTIVMPKEEYEKRILEKFHAYRRWENEPAPDWVKITDLDEEEIQVTLHNAIQLGRMGKPVQTDTESILRGLGLFDGDRLINAAIALYGKNERLFGSFPQLSIRFAKFRGTDRLSGFLDNRDYWGHAFSLLRRSDMFLLDTVPIAGRVVSGKIVREDYPLYPPLGTREAIANAICHRDYTMPGAAVTVAMYSDRLEIVNPGILHFDITPEKLARPHESKPWNPIIAGVFYRAGIIEKWGTGTINIIEKCRENQNPKPIWEVQGQSVITVFLPSAFFSKSESLSQSSEIFEIISETRSVPLELEILELLKKQTLSKAEIAKNLGHKHISGGLKKALQVLLKTRKIVCTIPEKPGSRFQKYKIVSMLNDSSEGVKARVRPESGPSQARVTRD